MKAFALFAAGLLLALPASSDTPSETPVAPAKPADPSIVKPKAIGRHLCLDHYVLESWAHSASGKPVVLVHVNFQITSDGAVNDVAVDRSSDDAKLDAYTIRCVGTWRYEPATKDGQAIDLPWEATLEYSRN